MKSKKRILILVVVILIFLGCGIGYYIYQDKSKQADINEKINEISESEKAFSTVKKRNDKFDILKSTFEEMDEYTNSPTKYDKVSDKYVDTVSNMQAVFKEEYDNTIKENTIDNLDSVEDTGVINASTENLNTLSTTIESEKEYTLSSDSEYQKYTEKISALTETYSNQITAIEEKQKAEEEAKKQAEEAAKKQAEEKARRNAEEEKAKTHYENEYFSVDVPAEWADVWSVSEQDNSLNGITSVVYTFSYDGDNVTTYPGGAMVYVLDMSDTSRPLSHYSRMIPSTCEEIGVTSFGNYDVFKTEAGAGFFSYGATITLK